MAKRRSKRESGGDGPIGGGWKQAAPAVILIGIVFIILILSAVLQTEPETAATAEPAPETDSAMAADAPPVREEAVREEPGKAPDPQPVSAVESRSGDDYRRISRHRTDWTLQFMIACDPDNARRILDRAQRSDRLYILPFDYDGRRCFRLCWGRYDTRDRAAANRSRLPAFIRELGASTPKSIGEVAP